MMLERNNVEINVEFERREKIMCNNYFISLRNAALQKNPLICISLPFVYVLYENLLFFESITRFVFPVSSL